MGNLARAGVLRRHLRADALRYRGSGGWSQSLGFWVGFTYRGGAFFRNVRPAPLRLPLLTLYKLTVLPFQFFRKLEIPARVPIGPGLSLPNPYCIIVPDTVEIGSGCTIHQGVTLGLGPLPGSPRLGNHVCLMPGSKVLGGVTLGDNVEVEANAVVTKHVPAGTVVASPTSRARTS